MTRPEENIHAIDPMRLAHGQWCHKRNRTIGEGDIAASYSADRIGTDRPVRKPFRFNGKDWVCTSAVSGEATAYQLVHLSQFNGDTFAYGEASRTRDPRGFYHAMQVRHKGQQFILSGPPLTFIEGEPEQMTLF